MAGLFTASSLLVSADGGGARREIIGKTVVGEAVGFLVGKTVCHTVVGQTIGDTVGFAV